MGGGSYATTQGFHPVLTRIRSAIYIDRFTIILLCDRPDPLSELNQKTDPSCLPNFKLLVCTLACVA
jgi:hypothetical protein